MPGRVLTALTIAASLVAVALVARNGVSTGPTAPSVNLAITMDDMDGGKVDLSSYAGKPLLINLWATWCGPCRIEMPQLNALAQKFKPRGVTIIGISVDDTPDKIREFAAEYKAVYPMLVGLGHEEFVQNLGYTGLLPFSILVRPDGTVAGQVTGLKTTADWEERIESLLR
jgi:thiol-disulfide isomerase/thioredoxin